MRHLTSAKLLCTTRSSTLDFARATAWKYERNNKEQIGQCSERSRGDEALKERRGQMDLRDVGHCYKDSSSLWREPRTPAIRHDKEHIEDQDISCFRSSDHGIDPKSLK